MRRLFSTVAVALFLAQLVGPGVVAAVARGADGCCTASCAQESCPDDESGACLPLCVDCSCSRSERALPCGPFDGAAPRVVRLPGAAPAGELPSPLTREVFHVPKPTA